MLHSQPQNTSIFRTSLRDWQASWKARQAAQASPSTDEAPAPAQATVTVTAGEQAKPRVKRLVAYKRRKLRQAERQG